MALGTLIRDLRQARGWSQSQLAERLCQTSGEHIVSREDVSRWEREKVLPGPRWRKILASALDAAPDVFDEEARISRVNRRNFLNLAALTATHGKLATEVTDSIGARDAGLLATAQTKYGTDMVIASMVDRGAVSHLRGWMRDGSSPVLRVNATGILAKVPDHDLAAEVATVLAGDEDVRHLYLTAVVSRSGAMTWTAATRVVNAAATVTRQQASFLMARLAHEAVNPRDVGARWCAATMLRELAPISC